MIAGGAGAGLQAWGKVDATAGARRVHRVCAGGGLAGFHL